MSTLLYGMQGVGVSPDEETVRATTEPVNPDAPPDVEETAPDNISEYPRPTTMHAGLSTAAMASFWTEGQQIVPPGLMEAQVGPSFSRINDNQALAGHAAALEAAGIFGHGSASFANAMEPVLREGAEFGQDYFAAFKPGVQPYAGNYMETILERNVAAANANRAKVEAGDAAVSGYADWAGAMMTGAWGG